MRTERGTAWPTLLLGALLAVAVIVVAVAFEGAGRRTPGCDAASPTPGLPGASGEEFCALPDLALERLDGNGSMDLREELRGGPAVVNFWASWCEPCVREMPLLARAAADLDGRVTFVGVDVQDQTDKARELAGRARVRYPLVSDLRGELYALVRGAGMPTTLFVDAQGTVVYRRTGEVDAGQLARLLREHLGVDWKPPKNR